MSANVAIQLRKNSRGETSRAVLDCMAYGLPIIINSHATFNEYSNQDFVKLPDLVQVQDLAQEMVRLRHDEAFRLDKGQRARKVIEEQHNPEKMAAAYAEVIHRAVQSDDRKLFAPLREALKELNEGADFIKSLVPSATENLSLRSQPRIIIDVSHILNFDFRSGIQRVVKSFVREFFLMNDPSLNIEIVWMSEGNLLRASRFTERLFGFPDQSLGPDLAIHIQPGDTLLLLDSPWFIYDQFMPIFEQIRKKGGKIITMVYDLLPIRYSEKFHHSISALFNKWLKTAIAQSDTLACISRSTADDVALYIAENQIPLNRQLDIAYTHLGADISIATNETKVRDEVKLLAADSDAPLFLTVGTLEPRKGHAFTLDAFEILWKQGSNCRLCFAGKVGWDIEETVNRLKNHPELGKRLIFIKDPSDAEINLCYSAATALVSASIAEGFGLPLVEAALHNVPIIASDIPIFHEIGGELILYFSLESPANLSAAVKAMAELTPGERLTIARSVKTLTWKESAARMLDVIDGKSTYLQLPVSKKKSSLKINEMLAGTESSEFFMGGHVFNLWHKTGDIYIASQDAISYRVAEANAFRYTCAQLLCDLNVESTTCLDVGANIGINSLVLGQLALSKKVITSISRIIAFEPEPITFKCLEENTQVFSNIITTVNCALGQESASLPFFRVPKTTSQSHVVTTAHVTGTANEVVQVHRLDHFVNELALPHVGLIKIDVEGHEKAVLEGAVETIEKFNPWIYLEFNAWTLMAYGGFNPREFLDYLLDRFKIVYKVKRLAGLLEPIKSKTEAVEFLHNNLVINGCVDDMVLRSR